MLSGARDRFPQRAVSKLEADWRPKATRLHRTDPLGDAWCPIRQMDVTADRHPDGADALVRRCVRIKGARQRVDADRLRGNGGFAVKSAILIIEFARHPECWTSPFALGRRSLAPATSTRSDDVVHVHSRRTAADGLEEIWCENAPCVTIAVPL